MAVAAGLAMLRYLKDHPEVYAALEENTARLTANPPPGVTVNRVGSMFTFFFTSEPVTDWSSAAKSDTTKFGAFFHAMLEHGIYLAPSQFEAGFVSAAHSDEDVERTVQAVRESGAR
jgi:glutamate-1-semialdehyde 2,1-aminomutase